MQALMASFIDHLRFEKNYSPHTVKSYSRDLEQFFRHLTAGRTDRKIKPSDLDHITIREFLSRLSQAGNRKVTIARKLSVLRSFFRYLYREGHLDRNPAKLVRTPRQPLKTPRFLSLSEVESILTLPPAATSKGLRDRAILELLYASGLRVGELVGLNLIDLSMTRQLVRVRGKGNKERVVPFGEPSRASLTAYLEAPAAHPGQAQGQSGNPGPVPESSRRPSQRPVGPEKPGNLRPASCHCCWTSILTCCAIPSPRICSTTAPTCARFRSSWDTRASPPLSAIPMSPSSISKRSTEPLIPRPDLRRGRGARCGCPLPSKSD